MDHQPPTLELLESRHRFPCPFTFKVIGPTGTHLPARAAACVQASLGLEVPPTFGVKAAAGGRHESVTLEPTCPDATSVIDLYAALRELEGVMFLF
ncbi:MAG: DUF493 domain-containing protein [Planctomycetota bacterium]|nr:DUF493 domain-containing protein [Planctomycetota bacterium]MDG1983325.1 DUF493 domain-containing protein [Planctomycetota bacterium]